VPGFQLGDLCLRIPDRLEREIFVVLVFVASVLVDVIADGTPLTPQFVSCSSNVVRHRRLSFSLSDAAWCRMVCENAG
jgi:hypothetical protein